MSRLMCFVFNGVKCVALAFFLASCSLDITVEDISSKDHDFLKSQILGVTEGIADGLTDLILTLELRNSDDSLIEGFEPSLTVLGGASATFIGCSKSNANGVSTCRFRSSEAGTATVAVADFPVDLSTEIEFTAPVRSGSFMQIVSSAQNNEDAGGYTVTSQIGAPVEGLRQVANGYEVLLSTTKGITPTDD